MHDDIYKDPDRAYMFHQTVMVCAVEMMVYHINRRHLVLEIWRNYILQQFCFHVCEQRQVRLSFWLDFIVSRQSCLRAVIINAHIWMDLA